MGQAQSLATEVEIQASPDAVRAVFMDFPRYKEWCSWTISPHDPTQEPLKLKANDNIKVDMKGMAFNPTIVDNSTDVFSWEGNLYGLLVGKHEFMFRPSEKNSGGTTATQAEEFRGPLAFLFGPGWSSRQNTLDNWNAFFEDLKKQVEKASS